MVVTSTYRILARRTANFNFNPKIQPSTSRGFSDAKPLPLLASTISKVSGPNNGHIQSDGLDISLSMPGSHSDGGTNPEALFGSGYASCFHASIGAVAGAMNIKLPLKKEDCVVESEVNLHGNMQKLDLRVSFGLTVKMRGVPKEDLERLVARAMEVCPIHKAIREDVRGGVNLVVME